MFVCVLFTHLFVYVLINDFNLYEGITDNVKKRVWLNFVTHRFKLGYCKYSGLKYDNITGVKVKYIIGLGNIPQPCLGHSFFPLHWTLAHKQKL